MIGDTLGNYQITGQMGRGGMGEIYRAKDQKLGRDVAIKVLPEEFAKNADRVSVPARSKDPCLSRSSQYCYHPGCRFILFYRNNRLRSQQGLLKESIREVQR